MLIFIFSNGNGKTKRLLAYLRHMLSALQEAAISATVGTLCAGRFTAPHFVPEKYIRQCTLDGMDIHANQLFVRITQTLHCGIVRMQYLHTRAVDQKQYFFCGNQQLPRKSGFIGIFLTR